MWALLMRALYGSGRQAEALEAYAQAREVIADELGVEPSAELRQLHQQMLRADAGSGRPAAATKTTAADSPFAAWPSGPQAMPSAATQAGPGDPPDAMTAVVTGPADAGPAYPAAAPLPLVAQLPADIPDFTGRAGHLQNLRDLLSGPRRPDSPGAVVVAAVIGAGGLGKTTLAVHAAHLLRPQLSGRPAVRQPGPPQCAAGPARRHPGPLPA